MPITRRRKDTTMTTPPAPELTAEHLDPNSPTYVPEPLRPYYDASPETPEEVDARVADKSWLGQVIRAEELARTRREAAGEYVAPPGPGGPGVRDHARARREPTESQWRHTHDRVARRIEAGWTPELRSAWLHEHRLVAAKKAYDKQQSQDQYREASTCQVCGRFRPGDVTSRQPVRTLPKVQACERCALVITSQHQRRLAEQAMDSGTTRAQLADRWLEAQADA